MSTHLRLERIRQIAVTVKDVERAVAFYRDVLGMRFLFQAPPGLAFFDCGGVRLMLTRAETSELEHPASILYYEVADIDEARATLGARGVVFETEPHVVHRGEDHDLWIGSFRDSEGNVLAIMRDVPRA